MSRPLSATLFTLALTAMACGAPQTSVMTSSEGQGAMPDDACPAGQAQVTRDGGLLKVTVAEAFTEAKDGDRIKLCPGRSLHHTTLLLSTVNDVVISGENTSLVASGDFPVVQLSKSSKVVLEGVHVVHEVGEWCAHGCVEIYDSSQMTVRNSELDGSGYFGIITTKVTDSEFRDNLFHNCHYGFSAWRSQGLTLTGNTFRDNRGANLETADGSSYANDVQADNTFGAVKPATAPPKSAP
ncbi:MAG: right-handed parallel beta-helix repeat-containing protein [Myxococcota bacterium]